MGAAQVIIQSVAWSELKKALYKKGKELEPKSTDFSDVKFEGFSFAGLSVVDCVRLIHPENSDDYIDIYDCGITVQQARNIIKTPIQGMNGTVKEFISDGDYNVTLKGRISSNEPDVFPQENTSKLIEFCQIPEVLQIESEYLRVAYGIHRFVIDGYTMQRKEGWSSVQEFELKCVSHLPVELILKEPQTV